jgi:heme-degrading monooxygenase HmoA
LILEVAVLDVKPNLTQEFEAAFQVAEPIIRGARGYLSHELLRSVERESRYVFLVRWERLEDHTEGFRGSAEYQRWRELLHHFYDPFPTVEHYAELNAI